METERLIIRKAQQSDVNEFLKIHNSEFVLKYNACRPYGEEEAPHILKTYEEDEGTFFIEYKKNHQFIGSISVESDSLRHGVNSVCLSYFLGEDYTRLGLMKEALNQIIEYCFNTQNVDIISARVFSLNIASQKLLESLNFQLEGCIRQCVKGHHDIIYDDCIYSLLKCEYKI